MVQRRFVTPEDRRWLSGQTDIGLPSAATVGPPEEPPVARCRATGDVLSRYFHQGGYFTLDHLKPRQAKRDQLELLL